MLQISRTITQPVFTASALIKSLYPATHTRTYMITMRIAPIAAVNAANTQVKGIITASFQPAFAGKAIKNNTNTKDRIVTLENVDFEIENFIIKQILFQTRN